MEPSWVSLLSGHYSNIMTHTLRNKGYRTSCSGETPVPGILSALVQQQQWKTPQNTFTAIVRLTDKCLNIFTPVSLLNCSATAPFFFFFQVNSSQSSLCSDYLISFCCYLLQPPGRHARNVEGQYLHSGLKFKRSLDRVVKLISWSIFYPQQMQQKCCSHMCYWSFKLYVRKGRNSEMNVLIMHWKMCHQVQTAEEGNSWNICVWVFPGSWCLDLLLMTSWLTPSILTHLPTGAKHIWKRMFNIS